MSPKTRCRRLICFLCALVTLSVAVQAADRHGAYNVFLLQGEELKVSQDFSVNIDNEKLRIALTQKGIVDGQAMEELTVALVQPDKEPQERQADENGEVVFEDVQPGISSLVVLGSREAAKAAQSMTYAAFAFFAKESDQKTPDDEKRPLEVPVAKVNTSSLLGDISKVEKSKRTDELMKLEDYRVKALNRFRVMRQIDGSLIGKVQVPQQSLEVVPGELQVSILKNGKVVASTKSREDGRFRVPNLELGFYSLSAVGAAGHAAYSFELVENSRKTAWMIRTGRVKPVAMQMDAANELDVLLIPPSLMQQVEDIVRDRLEGSGQGGPDGAGGPGNGGQGGGQGAGTQSGASGSSGQSFAGGGIGGGAGGGPVGGGGSIGAGGGLGGLIGVAGLAVGVSALSDDDDDGFNVNVATQISP